MISIIIPIFRAIQEDIFLQLDSLIQQDIECELIISDGEKDFLGSLVSMISDYISSSKISLIIVNNPLDHTVLSRGESMNLGAEHSHGDVLLFLHLDTILPQNGLQMISDILKDDRIIAGCFLKRYSHPFAFGITEWILNLRTILFNNIVGTNAMFIRRDFFNKNPFSKGFMEDVIYSDMLRKKLSRDKIFVISEPVVVSSYKYIKHGVMKRILSNFLIMYLYRIHGIALEDLEKMYRSAKDQSLYEIYKQGCRLIFSK